MNRLVLKSEGLEILIQENSISLVYKSPVFNEKDGSFSYDFDLRITRDIDELFNYPRVANRKTLIGTKRKTALFFNNLLIIEGDLRLMDINKDTITVTLGFAKGSFNDKIKNVEINKIGFLDLVNLGEDKISYFNNMINSKYPEQKFCLPTINNEGGYEFLKYTGKHKFIDGQNLYRNWGNGNNGYETFDDDNITETITPMIYLREIIMKFSAYFGYAIEESFFNDNADFNSLAVYSNLCDNYEKKDNEWYFDLNKYLPQMKWSKFIEQIDQTFNTVSIFNNNKRSYKILNKSDLLNVNKVNRFENERLAKIIRKNEVDVTKGYHYFYDMGNMEKRFKKELIDIFAPDSKYRYKGEVDNDGITQTSAYLFANNELYDVYLNTDQNMFISFEPDVNDNGQLFHFKEISINERRIITDENDFTEIFQKICPIKTGTQSFYKLDSFEESGTDPYQQLFNLQNVDVAKIDYKQVVNTSDERMEKVILLFYRGEVNDDPYANTDNVNYIGVSVGEESLHLNFMYNKYWKKWLDWYYSQRDFVELEIPLTHLDLFNLSYEIPYEFTELGITGFIDSLEVDLQTNQSSVGKIKIFLI